MAIRWWSWKWQAKTTGMLRCRKFKVYDSIRFEQSILSGIQEDLPIAIYIGQLFAIKASHELTVTDWENKLSPWLSWQRQPRRHKTASVGQCIACGCETSDDPRRLLWRLHRTNGFRDWFGYWNSMCELAWTI
jgi:hypothetical protein